MKTFFISRDSRTFEKSESQILLNAQLVQLVTRPCRSISRANIHVFVACTFRRGIRSTLILCSLSFFASAVELRNQDVAAERGKRHCHRFFTGIECCITCWWSWNNNSAKCSNFQMDKRTLGCVIEGNLRHLGRNFDSFSFRILHKILFEPKFRTVRLHVVYSNIDDLFISSCFDHIEYPLDNSFHVPNACSIDFLPIFSSIHEVQTHRETAVNLAFPAALL